MGGGSELKNRKRAPHANKNPANGADTHNIYTYRAPSSVATGRGQQDIGSAGGKTIYPRSIDGLQRPSGMVPKGCPGTLVLPAASRSGSGDRSSLSAVLPNPVGRLLGDHHRGEGGVPPGEVRHDRGIDDAQVLYSPNARTVDGDLDAVLLEVLGRPLRREAPPSGHGLPLPIRAKVSERVLRWAEDRASHARKRSSFRTCLADFRKPAQTTEKRRSASCE